MSDALTTNAPTEEPAAPSVETSAPGAEVAADGGSAGAEETVPASRFNGLMASMNRQKAEHEAQMTAVQAELASLRQTEETETEPVTDTDSALAEELRETRQAMQSLVLERARDKALEKYPEAKPFSDLIFGGNADEIEEVARVVAERAKVLAPEAPEASEEPETPAAEDGEPTGEETPAPEGAATEPPVVGGPGAPATGQEAVTDAVSEALQGGDLHAYLVARSEAQADELAKVE